MKRKGEVKPPKKSETISEKFKKSDISAIVPDMDALKNALCNSFWFVKYWTWKEDEDPERQKSTRE
jgi:hypothetical protein